MLLRTGQHLSVVEILVEVGVLFEVWLQKDLFRASMRLTSMRNLRLLLSILLLEFEEAHHSDEISLDSHFDRQLLHLLYLCLLFSLDLSLPPLLLLVLLKCQVDDYEGNQDCRYGSLFKNPIYQVFLHF